MVAKKAKVSSPAFPKKTPVKKSSSKSGICPTCGKPGYKKSEADQRHGGQKFYAHDYDEGSTERQKRSRSDLISNEPGDFYQGSRYEKFFGK